MRMQKLVIAVCTRDKETFDGTCAQGLAAQQKPTGYQCEILLVENNASATESSTTDRIGGLQLHHVIERELGLVNARNRALIEAESLGADWLIFVDDDAIPLENWLCEYASAIQANPDSYFFHGQIWYRFPHGYSFGFPRDPENVDELSRRPTKFGCTNLMLHRSVFSTTGYNLKFDAQFSACGGEDVDYRRQAIANGLAPKAVPTAVVSETIGESRTSISVAIKRHINHGVASITLLKKYGNPKANTVGLSLQLPKLCIGAVWLALRALFAYATLSKHRLQAFELAMERASRLSGLVMALCGYKGSYYNRT